MAQGGEAAAVLAVDPGTENEMLVPIEERMVVGRECAGVPEHERLLVRDESVSRKHLEITLDRTGDRAWVIDTSSNGTLLNGTTLSRSMPVPLRAGDRLVIGALCLEFRSTRFRR